MTALIGYLVVAGLGILAAIVAWFGGGRSARMKLEKQRVEKQRDRALEVTDEDAQALADYDVVRSMPAGPAKLAAASKATGAVVDSWKRRRSDR